MQSECDPQHYLLRDCIYIDEKEQKKRSEEKRGFPTPQGLSADPLVSVGRVG